MRWQRLFREAAQLKTVTATVCETGGKGLCGKIQKYTVGSAGRGCPTVPVMTDISCDTFIVCPPKVAVARGGAHKASSWQLLPYLCLTLADETSGAHCNVSCGPPLREASARAALRAAKAQPKARPKAKPKALPRVRLTAAPLSLRRIFARLRDSFYFGPPPKSLNRSFRRGARLL